MNQKKVLLGIFAFFPVIYWITLFIFLDIFRWLHLDFTAAVEVILGMKSHVFPICFAGSIIIILTTRSIENLEKLLWIITLYFTICLLMPLFWYRRIYKVKTL